MDEKKGIKVKKKARFSELLLNMPYKKMLYQSIQKNSSNTQITEKPDKFKKN